MSPAPVSTRTWPVALVLALWLLVSIAWRPLLLPDEGRYAGVAWEMLQQPQGSAWVPTLDGLPFFHKPPLLYWLDMPALWLLGPVEFAARLGPALLGWVLGMALYLHLQRWHGLGAARIGLAVLATSPLYFLGSQYVNHDIGVAACITAAVLALVRAVDDPSRTAPGWCIAGWALCGLGILAKGLIGIVLPVLVVGPWLLAQGRWRQMFSLLNPLGLLACVAVVLPWMAVMQARHPGFFDYFIIEQHFRRYTGAGFNNRMPFWFYGAVLPLLTLPWSLWLWPALRRALPLQPLTGLYLWWVVVIVGFFSLPSSKIVGYVMPALAPWAALLALALQARGSHWPRVAGAAAVAGLALVAGLAWKAPGSHRELGRALAEQVHAADRVVFIDDYFYDLPFYAGLRAPVVVVSDWDSPEIARHDNWRKELSDATRFSADRGADVLWTWSRLGDIDCAAGPVWVVAAAEHHARLQAAIAGLERVRVQGAVELLRAPGRHCAAPP